MFWKKSAFDKKELRLMANAARLLALDAIQTANSGHPGVALGFADVMTTLFANHLEFDPKVGDWDNRDRLVLSMGHASALLYSVLHLAGYPISRQKLRTFRRLGGLPGHPERNPKMGVELTTGPLGQGLAAAVGIAMARPKNDVYVLASDGDLMEGVAQEAASFAGFRKLRNLIVLWDDNGITIDGRAATAEDVPAKFRAMGWDTVELDGMRPREIDRALRIAKKRKSPVLLACKTVIGYGSADAGTEKVHGSPLDYDDGMRLMSKLTGDFEAAKALWKKLSDSKKAGGHKSESRQKAKAFAMPDVPKQNFSTRELFNVMIRAAAAKNPNLIIGGSADLSQSTGSLTDDKNYVRYGVREHAMGAIMNGLAAADLYPYGGTFLVFSDYMRGAMREAALMNLPVLFVFSHDSIALGEDGPTHQPIEQLPSIRLIPNMTVFRPCNARETFLCLRRHFDSGGPSAMVLSRQAFAPVPENTAANCGGYAVLGAKNAEVKLIATGSEVALAASVRGVLESKNIKTSVMSVPSLEIMMGENRGELAKFLSGGFSVWIGASAEMPPFSVSMVVRAAKFGESGNGADVYKKYGFDAGYIADEIAKKIKKL
ncbi:MAG: hypothetical protein LBL21_02955 [Rickettsiales bacterium]|jgi:transketolase|nr:hypothetical protein [Rickettsiales bacterium]